MGLFLWPTLIIMAPTTTWGLWLCLAGWLCSLFTLCLSIVRKQEEPNATSTEALSLQQPARRRIVRGFVGLAGLGSLGLGGFLWSRWTYHQHAIFRRRYLEPRDYQVTGLINETRSWVLQVSWSPDSKRLLIGQLHVAHKAGMRSRAKILASINLRMQLRESGCQMVDTLHAVILFQEDSFLALALLLLRWL